MFVKVELYKILRSRQSLFCFITVLLMVFIVAMTYKVRDAVDISALDLAMISLGNMLRAFIFNIFIILITSLAFSSEFQDQTIRYVLIRAVNKTTLLYSKIIAIYIFNLLILVLICLSSIIIGLLFWELTPLHGIGGAILKQSGLRFFIMYLATWFNTQFFIYFTAFITLMQRTKDQVSTVVLSVSVYIFIIILTNFFTLLEKITPVRAQYINPFLWSEQINYRELGIGAGLVALYCFVLFFGIRAKFKQEEV